MHATKPDTLATGLHAPTFSHQTRQTRISSLSLARCLERSTLIRHHCFLLPLLKRCDIQLILTKKTTVRACVFFDAIRNIMRRANQGLFWGAAWLHIDEPTDDQDSRRGYTRRCTGTTPSHEAGDSRYYSFVRSFITIRIYVCLCLCLCLFLILFIYQHNANIEADLGRHGQLLGENLPSSLLITCHSNLSALNPHLLSPISCRLGNLQSRSLDPPCSLRKTMVSTRSRGPLELGNQLEHSHMVHNLVWVSHALAAPISAP